MPDVSLSVQPNAPIGTISPRLYGHFAEHLGRCCYDGLWVGAEQHDVPHEAGFRSDVIAALRGLPVPLLRWPGGCYADHYHWRDGIGPAADRPRRLGMSCGLQVLDDNSLGTDEFLRFRGLIGAEPYLAGNVGSGTPQELCDWLEYCNAALGTSIATERMKNGAAAPYGVRLWGVGNENWGCGGNYDAVTYAKEYRRYATMLRHVDPAVELVACGFEDEWNTDLLASLTDNPSLIDHLSIHCYWREGGPETDFSDDDYDALLAEARATEAFIARTAALIAETFGSDHRVGVALDEWGVWHPEARLTGPGDVERRQPVSYEQANTMRDAVAAAVALAGFHRQSNVLTLANLAQVVNILQAPVMTDGAAMWLTPTYHALQLHAPHIGATALPVEVEHGDRFVDGACVVEATASQLDGALAITVVNQERHRARGIRIGGVSGDRANGRILTAGDPRDGNSATEPERVRPANLPVAADGPDAIRIELPPHSIATVVIRS